MKKNKKSTRLFKKKNKGSACLCEKQNNCPIVCGLKNNSKITYLILGLIVIVASIFIVNAIIKRSEEIKAPEETKMPQEIITEEEMPKEIPITEEEMPKEIPITEEEMPKEISITEEEIRELVAIRKEKVIQWDNPPEMMIDKEINYTAIIRTSKGDIYIELFNRENPITVNNFVFLAEQGFYDGIIFHRVIEGFMIQAGRPRGDGTDGPGYVIPCEFRPDNRNDRYTISMANAGPDTGGSQFFINVVDNNGLDILHPVFGRVIQGKCVSREIAEVETTGPPRDRPIKDVVIIEIDIIRT